MTVIRNQSARRTVLALLAFAPCLMTLAMFDGHIAHAQGPGGASPASAVAAAEIVEQPIPDNREFVGTLTPLKRSIVGTAVDGRVEEYNLREGMWVEAGQPLVELRKRTIQIEIAAANAELSLRKQEFAEVEAGLRPEEKARARARLEETRALLTYTTEKLARTQKLFQGQGSTTREEYDLAVSQAQAANQAFLAAQADVDLAEKGNRVEQIEQSRARMEGAQEQVNLLEDRLEKYSIKAPFDGYVVAENTEVGEWVKSGDPIFEIIAVDPMEVTVNVPEKYLPGLQKVMATGDAAEIPTLAVVNVDAIGFEPFTGTVIQVVPQADLRSRTFPVKVHLPNESLGRSHRFAAGMLAHVRLPVGQERPGTLVPKDALVLGDVKPAIFIGVTDATTKETVARKVPVEMGLSHQGLVQVTSLLPNLPLQAGQMAIVRGNERLRDGQPIRIVSHIDSGVAPATEAPPPAEPSPGASARVER
jgi:RND family efflux transporter MFP subunit